MRRGRRRRPSRRCPAHRHINAPWHRPDHHAERRAWHDGPAHPTLSTRVVQEPKSKPKLCSAGACLSLSVTHPQHQALRESCAQACAHADLKRVVQEPRRMRRGRRRRPSRRCPAHRHINAPWHRPAHAAEQGAWPSTSHTDIARCAGAKKEAKRVGKQAKSANVAVPTIVCFSLPVSRPQHQALNTRCASCALVLTQCDAQEPRRRQRRWRRRPSRCCPACPASARRPPSRPARPAPRCAVH